MALRFSTAARLLLAASCVFAQQKPAASVRDGVYTDEQAARGESGYGESCASCHGSTLGGKGQNPPLAGSDFTSNWNGRALDELFEKIQVSMPADHPGQLSRSRNAEILAYILKRNQLPAGKTELPTDAESLHKILFETGK